VDKNLESRFLPLMKTVNAEENFHFFSKNSTGCKIKTAENGVCFYLYKFALQTFLSTAISHFVAKLQ